MKADFGRSLHLFHVLDSKPITLKRSQYYLAYCGQRIYEMVDRGR